MEAVPSSHPADEALDAYRQGRLDARTASAVRKHLDGCAQCQGRIALISRVPATRAPEPAPTMEHEGVADATRTYVRPEAPEAESHPLPPALVDHPDYSIKRELGRGGMGVVYLAHNTLLGRDEVLKVMRWPVGEHSGGSERFLREIRAVASLRHPNIVTAYSAARRGDGIVFAMEYVEGLDLSKLVRSKGPIPVAHACHFICQAALGLQHAHENGLVHRDIKPGNLMLSRAGNRATVKVLDFGLAKVSREDHGLTEEGRPLGTPDFIAPEQLLDAQSADIRADIYSLGATLYYLLSGRPPYRARSLVEVYRAHVESIPDPLNQIQPNVPIELARVVETMMARDPAGRIQTPAEVARALAPFFKKGAEALKNADPDPSMASKEEEPSAESPPPTLDSASGHAVPGSKPLESTVRDSGWENLIVIDPADDAVVDQDPPRAAWLWPAAVVGIVLVAFTAVWASGRLSSAPADSPDAEVAVEDEAGDDPETFPTPVSNEAQTPTRPLADRTPEPVAAPVPPAEPARVEAAPTEPAASAPPALAVTSTPAPAEPAKIDFEPLFNRVDLSGWVPRGSVLGDWVIQDESLSFRDRGARVAVPPRRLTPQDRKRLAFRVRNDHAALLFTERPYVDFALRLEFRTSEGGSGGIVLADLDRGDRLPRYAEFVINHNDSLGWKTGDFLSWNFGTLVRQSPARSVDLKSGDDWNRLELESQGGVLHLRVNGQPVDYNGSINLEGPRRIGLRGLAGDVRYRKLELRGRPATLEGANGQPRLLIGRTIYADDLSNPATGWSTEDIDNGPGQTPFKRNYENGYYYLQAPPNWSGTSAWNVWGSLSQDYQLEAVGRVVGDANQAVGAWMLIAVVDNSRGFQVSIDRLGRLTLEGAFWGAEKYPNEPRIGPFSHPAIRPGNEWNEVTLRVRKRRLEVLVNSVRVCEPLILAWDLLPAVPQIAVQKPGAESRIRAEFDWLELRELAAEGP